MTKYLVKAASSEVLSAAWKKSKKQQTPWTQDISNTKMKQNPVLHLLKLSEDLKNGCFKPEGVSFFPIQKSHGGKKRIISDYSLRDKVAQRAVLIAIVDKGEKIFHQNSFGYRPKRSVDMAVAKAREYIRCGMRWIVDSDIENCFNEILQKQLIKKCAYLLKDKQTVSLIEKWIVFGKMNNGYRQKNRGIPQGMILSPFLCNLYLTEWDNYLTSSNIPFVRFADDLLLFAKNKKESHFAFDFARKKLNMMGLNINRDKTIISKVGNKIEYLGKKLL